MPNGVASMAHIFKSLAIFRETEPASPWETVSNWNKDVSVRTPSALLVFYVLRIA
jgi:hypothetical protein